MLGVKVIRHRFWVEDLVAKITALPQLLLVAGRQHDVGLQVVGLQILWEHVLVAKVALGTQWDILFKVLRIHMSF
jgi:hypothetical protein